MQKTIIPKLTTEKDIQVVLSDGRRRGRKWLHNVHYRKIAAYKAKIKTKTKNLERKKRRENAIGDGAFVGMHYADTLAMGIISRCDGHIAKLQNKICSKDD
jgi:hypothetical protein